MKNYYITFLFFCYISIATSFSYSCNHTVRLLDTFGDGWNGGTITVKVNGVNVLVNITLAAGAGPSDIVFNANTGDAITIVETAAGAWPTEMRVQVFDGGMNSIIANHDPVGGAGTNGVANCPPPMSYTSSTTTQSSVATVTNCASNAQIIRLEITTAGVTSPLNITQIQTQFSGTAVFGNASSTKVYYTGTSNVFSTATLFGTAVPAAGTYNINGNQNLTTGTNYFWLVYDLNNTGTIGNTIDATIPQFTLSAVNRIPTITNPAGNRTITICIVPGGVYSGLETWLKSDLGVVGAAPITGWTNQNSSGTPILVNGAPNINSASTAYNYNPYIDFTAPVGTLPDGAAANRQFLKYSGYNDIASQNLTTLFFAFNLTDLTRANTHIGCVEGITYSAGPVNGSLHGEVTTGSAAIHQDVYDNDFGSGAPANTWQRNGTNVAFNAIHSSSKHILSANCTTGGNTGINRLLGGQIDDGGGFFGHLRDWKGPVAEIIAYTSSITATQRQKIDSYLAIKYGITLNTNYLSTNGGTIFTTAAPYNLNIIGIGRDDVEALNQKQSHNDDDKVRIYLNNIAATNSANVGAFTNDISYVVIGANSGALCSSVASNAEVPSPSLAGCALYSRLEREWKITRTNITQNFNIDVKLDACGLPGNVNVAHLRLLVDTDGNFANGGTTCYYNGDGTGIVFSYSNPTITISNLNIANHFPNNSTRYMTIASINSATPLPVEIIDYNIKLNDGNTSTLAWTTLTERENDYFQIEKSINGEDWGFLTNIDGAGNTNISQYYSFIDYNVVSGINYYRLNQIDFNGTKKEIGIKSININSNIEFSIFPNPTTDILNIYSSKNNPFHFKIYNQLGELIMETNESTISLKKYDSGIYYVRCENDSNIEIIKIIKK